jgi:ABC-type branched-subunit amino acid transport system substrate-binding protein
MRSTLAIVAAFSSALLVASAAGCSSSKTKASGGPTGATAATAGSTPTSGPPIKLFGIADYSGSPNNTYPEAIPAAQAAVKAANAAGGVHGRPLEISFCSDQNNPNDAAACARQAVSSGAVAVDGPNSLYGSNIIPILQHSSMAYVGNDVLGADDGSNPVAFPLGGSELAYFGGMGQWFSQHGCKAGGVLGVSNTASAFTATLFKAGMKVGGGTVVKVIDVPLTGVPDYSAQIAALSSAGVKCLALSIPPTEVPKLLSAAHQFAPNMEIGIYGPGVTSQLLAQEGPVAEGLYGFNDSYLPTDNVAVVNQITKTIHQYYPGASVTPTSLRAFAGTEVIIQALKQVSGPITPESVLSQMNNITNFRTGVYPPLTTTKPSSLPGLSHLFQAYANAYQVKNGKLVQVSDGFFTLSQVEQNVSG